MIENEALEKLTVDGCVMDRISVLESDVASMNGNRENATASTGGAPGDEDGQNLQSCAVFRINQSLFILIDRSSCCFQVK